MVDKVNKKKVRKQGSRKKTSGANTDSVSEHNATTVKGKLDKREVNVQVVFIFLLVSVVTTLYLLTLSNKLTTNIQVAGQNLIQVQIEITSDRYRESYAKGNKDVRDCGSEATYADMSNSTVFLNQSNGKYLGETKLGTAIAFNYSKCTFKTSLPIKTDFEGGEVQVYVKFPFSQSEVFVVDLGSKPPYQIDLEFNLD